MEPFLPDSWRHPLASDSRHYLPTGSSFPDFQGASSCPCHYFGDTPAGLLGSRF